MEFGFERLEAWKKSRILVKAIYKLVRNFPTDEKSCLSAQLRRAVISISSNIAEGAGRISTKEKLHFCNIAYGSLMEVTCQLILAEDLGFITSNDNESIRPIIEETERLIRGYHNFLKEQNK